MFLLRRVIYWIFLIPCTSARGLEIFEDSEDEVTCSQVESDTLFGEADTVTGAAADHWDLFSSHRLQV